MNKSSVLALAVSLATIGGGTAQAQTQEWDFRGFIYLWGATLGGTTVTGQDMELSFGDLLDALDFGLMGALEANTGRWSFLGDFQYLDLSEGQNAAFGPGIPAVADADVTGFVFSGTAGYELIDASDSSLIGFGGLRFMDLDTTANLAVGPGSQRVSGTLSNWDAIVGLRGSQQLADRWMLSYYGDVGAGDSDLTWQAALTLDYRINNWDLSFGYRHLAWEVSNSAVVTDIEFSGPFIGAKFRF